MTTGFAAVPNWLVEEPTVSSHEKLVYLVLSSKIGDQGAWFIGHSKIAEQAGISVASVKRALLALKERGVVSWTERYDPASRARLGNSYRLMVDRLGQGDPPPSSQGATPQLSVSEQNKNPEKEPINPIVPSADEPEDDEPAEPSPLQRLIEEVWTLYPPKRRSTSKMVSQKITTLITTAKAAERGPLAEEVVTALRAHVAAWATWPASDQQFIPLLTTWLNQERWTGAVPETRNGNGAAHAGLTNAAGQPAPYGLTPGGRRMGPPAGAGEHPRSPYLGMAWMASRHGAIINRSRTTIRREPTEDEKRILNGADD